MLAFAGNSILCRMALGEDNIDAVSFTVIRLLSGVCAFIVILPIYHRYQLGKSAQVEAVIKIKSLNNIEPSTGRKGHSKGSWLAGSMLYVYAIMFSFSYISLDTGIGALILFGSVQMTLILSNLLLGKNIRKVEWLGILLAISGFVYLVFPELTKPAFGGFIMMAIAGVAWGVYTLKGQGSTSPIEDTAYNFIRTLPFVALTGIVMMVYAYFISASHPYLVLKVNQLGVIYAVLSGIFASAIGYFIWYQALAGLTTIQASTVQLIVPILAALGGLLLLDELFTLRLTIASAMVLGGIFVVTLFRAKKLEDENTG